jgi:predicted HNH restriction endonuclease
MTSEKEKQLLLLLAMVDLGGGGTKRQVLDVIETQSWMTLTDDDQEILESRNEPKWRNSLAFERKHLVTRRYASDEVRGRWQITESGTEYFHELCHQVRATTTFQHVSDAALLKIRSIQPSPPALSDDNALVGETEFQEGGKIRRWTNRYERDPHLRAKAIEIHGTTCMGCGFSFEQAYGGIGCGFIEVHHVKPVSAFERGTVVDAELDMITLCSNCHSIVHRKKSEPLPLEDLKAVLNSHGLSGKPV